MSPVSKTRGLSLVEVVMSTLLTSLVLVIALQALAGTKASWRAAEQVRDGLGLAQELLAEINGLPYKESGSTNIGLDSLEGGSNRSAWDDVDDYHGLNESPPRDKSGNALTGFTGWRWKAQVEFVQALSPGSTTSMDQGLKRITVTIIDPTGRQTVLVTYRSQYGALEQAPSGDETLQTAVISEIQFGSGTKLENGVNLQNHARDR